MEVILGLDPGRDKFGWAFVAPDGSLLASGIIPSARAEELVGFLLAGNLEGVSSFTRENPGRIDRLDSPGVILLGNGTARQGLAGILVSEKRPSPFSTKPIPLSRPGLSTGSCTPRKDLPGFSRKASGSPHARSMTSQPGFLPGGSFPRV
jgi:hypothetical protein